MSKTFVQQRVRTPNQPPSQQIKLSLASTKIDAQHDVGDDDDDDGLKSQKKNVLYINHFHMIKHLEVIIIDFICVSTIWMRSQIR